MKEKLAIEKKLLEYRKRKERETYIENTKLKAKTYLKGLFRSRFMQATEDKPSEQQPFLQDDEKVNVDEGIETTECCSYLDWIHYILWFTLWLILYTIFIKLEFGLVYLVMSGLVVMYLNTRTTPRKPNEASAYSVFNKNCESIDGTLKAEQFERELIYGPTAIR